MPQEPEVLACCAGNMCIPATSATQNPTGHIATEQQPKSVLSFPFETDSTDWAKVWSAPALSLGNVQQLHLERHNTADTDSHIYIITAIVCAELHHIPHVFRLRVMQHITCLQLRILSLEMSVADVHVPGPGCSPFSRPSLVAVMHYILHSSSMHCGVHQCIQWGRSRGATVLGAAMTMYTICHNLFAIQAQ